MERRLFLLFTIVIVFFASCQRSEYPGFKEADSGLLYKIHVDNKGEKAKAGDYISVEMTYLTNEDSLLFDAKGQSFPLHIEPPVFPGDINEALTLLGVGDSATFVIRADSFLIKNAKLNALPPFVDESSKVIFHIKLHNIQTLEELEKEEDLKKQMIQDKEKNDIQQYLNSNNITKAPTASGMYYLPTKKGNGTKAVIGKKAKAHYIGRFLNGVKFDSSYDRNKPIEFVIGTGQILPGMDEGISMMRVGEEATLIIPSILGYGAGRGEIPPYTPLLFEVKLIDVK